jgi:hypothetical protein
MTITQARALQFDRDLRSRTLARVYDFRGNHKQGLVTSVDQNDEGVPFVTVDCDVGGRIQMRYDHVTLIVQREIREGVDS